MKKVIIIIAIAALAGAGLYFAFRGKEAPAQYKTEKVVKGDMTSSVSVSGTLNAVTTVQVGTQVSGVIKRIYVDFNSRVKKGQTIAELDPTLFTAQAEQAEARLFSASAAVERANAAFREAKRVRDRSAELFPKGFVSKSEMDTAESNYESAHAALDSAKAQAKEAEAALNYSRTNLKNTRILSPVDGIVVSRNVDEGQTVAASFQTPTLFTIAGDLTRMQINTNVDEADIGKIRPGQEAEFTVDAYPTETFKSKVLQVRNAPIIQQNVVTYDVVVSAENKELKLKPGMTANVSIIVAEIKDALKVPNAALRFVPEEKNSGRNNNKRGPGATGPKGLGIWLLEAGAPKRIEVKGGINDGNFTEIVSGDLKEGLEVIVESSSKKENSSSRPRGPRFY